MTAGAEEPNAIVELRTGARKEPNTRATTAELFDGLVAQSQNRWPSLAFDAMAINDRLSNFLTAGFYYKTFMWPKAFWEKIINWDALSDAGTISADDLDLFRFVDTAEEAIEIIDNWGSTEKRGEVPGR